jgi:ribonuclease T1
MRSRLWLIWLGLLLCLPLAAKAHVHRHDPAATGQVSAAELPPEARATLQRIKRGGPFPYPRDGVVFGNYEHSLPQHPRGYYHEYTVKTPDAHNRGAKRIVCGAPPECYYSDDHYRTFRRIKE